MANRCFFLTVALLALPVTSDANDFACEEARLTAATASSLIDTDPSKAENMLHDVLGKCPSFNEASHNLGVLYFKQGRFDDAVIYLQNALRDNNREPYRLDLIRAQIGGLRPIADILESIESLPQESASFSEAMRELSEYVVKAADQADGFSALEKYLAAHDNTVIRRKLALIYTSEGFFKEAISHLTILIEQFPSDEPLFLSMGRALHETNDSQHAIEYLVRATELNPKSGEAWALLALIAHKSGDIDTAIEAYQTAAILDPKNVSYTTQAGLLLVKRDPAKAIPLLENALRLDSTQAPVANGLGYALFKEERFEDAEDAYGRAVALSSRDAGALFGLALSQMKNSSPTKAKTTLEKLLRVDPRNDEARKLLEQLTPQS